MVHKMDEYKVAVVINKSASVRTRTAWHASRWLTDTLDWPAGMDTSSEQSDPSTVVTWQFLYVYDPFLYKSCMKLNLFLKIRRTAVMLIIPKGNHPPPAGTFAKLASLKGSVRKKHSFVMHMPSKGHSSNGSVKLKKLFLRNLFSVVIWSDYKTEISWWSRAVGLK